ncbi:cell division protein SepF [Streptococcus minor]|uniref:Cell division protein SepF n=1 Tax=Streptococcus minor TaxID=229549 RepID=A0A3P1VA67_9STRE|nr:cell division protein SepF [Streptococcus minor]RRD31124.1 cell division protein SepF [Streptococcus minor]
MALKDKFKGILSYFEIDDSVDGEDQESYRMENDAPKMRIAPVQAHTEREEPVEMRRTQNRSQLPVERNNLQRLHERQQELQSEVDAKKTTIDIKFPKKYEEAREIVNLLLENASILIDFQYMSETQARRCLDYLDGARSVLAGNLKKVSNTMWLLTPVNVTVKIEELRSTSSTSSELHFDYDMRR